MSDDGGVESLSEAHLPTLGLRQRSAVQQMRAGSLSRRLHVMIGRGRCRLRSWLGQLRPHTSGQPCMHRRAVMALHCSSSLTSRIRPLQGHQGQCRRRCFLLLQRQDGLGCRRRLCGNQRHRGRRMRCRSCMGPMWRRLRYSAAEAALTR